MLNNMKIGTRLTLGFTSLLILLALISILSILNMATINKNTEQVTVRYYPQTVVANDILDNVNIAARSIRNIIMLSDEGEMKNEEQRVIQAGKAIDQAIANLEKVTQSAAGKALLVTLNEARKGYHADQSEAIRLAMAQQNEEAVSYLLNEMRFSQNLYFQAVEDMVEHVSNRVESSGEAANAAYEKGRLFILLLTAI